MKAAVLYQFKSPFKIEDVRSNPMPGFVKVNVKVVGVCGRDVVIWKGGFKNFKLPAILGHEIFGFYNDKPVAVYSGIFCGNCKFCKQGKENLCDSYSMIGENTPGGYAEEVYAPERNLIELPDKNFEKYASASEPVATIIHASNLAQIKKGDKVLVTGASGAVGIHGIQYLNILGAEVYGLTSKPEIVKEAGGIPIGNEDLKRERFDVIMELVGSITINDDLRSLKKEGTLVLIGNIEGVPITLNRPAMSIMREHKIIGNASFTVNEFKHAIKLIAEGKIRPYFKTFSLEEINEAYKTMLERRQIGKTLLKI
ncbi:alcohol dehydrogenase catalytic domain-containing protein [Acidianus sp. RZ1]|uniref:alcohol dehydrogenase catalytic domain-containing protein n=1 Tax=Acidianus sp. RZ1 TaxID=1540082 RepID=UPI00149185C4|nr:alcohol dehydrogenase catalytic domain-containing protein [Acidianus sp. RZ1]NON61276.1 alcohol dehydrogenase catalytic domain-containing protein [Acidianus sp. RZ1]